MTDDDGFFPLKVIWECPVPGCTWVIERPDLGIEQDDVDERAIKRMKAKHDLEKHSESG